MLNFLSKFWAEDNGQDMVEYTLRLAFVALAAGGAYATIGNTINGIWSKAQRDIANAAAVAK